LLGTKGKLIDTQNVFYRLKKDFATAVRYEER